MFSISNIQCMFLFSRRCMTVHRTLRWNSVIAVHPANLNLFKPFLPQQPLLLSLIYYPSSTMSESTIVLITGKLPVASSNCTLLTPYRRQFRYRLCNSPDHCVPAELPCNNGQSRPFQGTGGVFPPEDRQRPRNTFCHSTGCRRRRFNLQGRRHRF